MYCYDHLLYNAIVCTSKKIPIVITHILLACVARVFSNEFSLKNDLTLVNVRERRREGSIEELEGRRRGMLTSEEWCNPVGNMLHHV